jgi:hypothetical protein
MSDAMKAHQHAIVYCDSVQSVGVHNGNARLLLTRLSVDGQTIAAVELIMPGSEVKGLISALQKISK